MNLDSDYLEQYISENDIAAQIVHLQTETPTVELAAEAVGVKPSQIGKSLLFIVAGAPLLVIASGTTRVAYKSLAKFLGKSRKKIKLANPDQVKMITGYPVGTVPPFGHKRVLPTLLEKGVTDQEELYVGGGAISSLMRIRSEELLRVTRAEIVSLTSLGADG